MQTDYDEKWKYIKRTLETKKDSITTNDQKKINRCAKATVDEVQTELRRFGIDIDSTQVFIEIYKYYNGDFVEVDDVISNFLADQQLNL